MTFWQSSILAVLVSCALSGAADAQALSRQQAVDIAVESSPRLAEAKAQVDAARAAAFRTRSDFLPRVTLNASGGVSDRQAQAEDGATFAEQANPTTVSLELNQTLYASGQRSLSLGLARLAVERARLNLERTERDLVLQTRLTFESAYNALKILDIERQARNAIQAQLDGAVARERAGTATQTDIAQAEARLAEAEARIATAQAERDIAFARMEALTGELFIAVTRAPAPRIPLPDSVSDLIDDSLAFDPDLRALNILEREARIQIILADRRYGPTVSLSASAQRVDDPSPLLDRDDEARAVVSLSVPLFNGGARAADRRVGLAERDRARFSRLDYQRNLVAQVRGLSASLRSAEIALSAQENREQAAQAALSGVEEGLEAGLSSTLDVLDAVRELQAAQRARLNAERAVIEAELNLGATTGSLMQR